MSLYQIQQDIKEYFIEGVIKESSALNDEAYRKLSVYKSLVFNSLNSLLSKLYPLCKKVIEASENLNWESVVEEYLKQYPSNSPILNRAAKDFSEFCSKNKIGPKYLAELANYEWLELKAFVSLAEDNPSEGLRLTPVHFICSFKYPITEIIEQIQNKQIPLSTEEKSEQILVYRNEESLESRFLRLSSTSALAIQLFEHSNDLEEISEALEEVFQIPEAQRAKLRLDLEKLINDLKERNILLE